MLVRRARDSEPMPTEWVILHNYVITLMLYSTKREVVTPIRQNALGKHLIAHNCDGGHRNNR